MFTSTFFMLYNMFREKFMMYTTYTVVHSMHTLMHNVYTVMHNMYTLMQTMYTYGKAYTKVTDKRKNCYIKIETYDKIMKGNE